MRGALFTAASSREVINAFLLCLDATNKSPTVKNKGVHLQKLLKYAIAFFESSREFQKCGAAKAVLYFVTFVVSTKNDWPKNKPISARGLISDGKWVSTVPARLS